MSQKEEKVAKRARSKGRNLKMDRGMTQYDSV